MDSRTRRRFLLNSSTLAASGLIHWNALGNLLTSSDAREPLATATSDAHRVSELHIATFWWDVSPPLGHPLCGGWITPVVGYDDGLDALGLVILGAGKPIVLCSVDWTGLCNEAHLLWRKGLAEAAGTTPDRVAVQCVHQHNAPFVCLETQRIIEAEMDLPGVIDRGFFDQSLDRGREAIRTAIGSARRVTHIATGQSKVEKVAGNRRLIGPDGRCGAMRGSSSKNPEHHLAPEGLIDPYLKTVAFFDGANKVAALHYYACHPMSYYGDGRVSADFCGLARRRRQQQEPGCLHVYFNGCGGNIGAGKYNDGSPPMREVLTDRVHAGIVSSEEALQPEPIESVSWTTNPILPATHMQYSASELEKQIHARENNAVARSRPAFTLSWVRRQLAGEPILLSGLHVNHASLLHLPAECFVEYQLRAQEINRERFVACAAYGDGGPWYIPTAEAYPQGGYEVSVAWCSPAIDEMLTRGIRKLLNA